MAKISNKYLTLIICALAFVLWNTIVLLVADLPMCKASFWCAFAFIDVAFIAVACITSLTKITRDSNFSANTPIYVFSAVYFAITFVFNLIFLILPSSEKILGNLIPNLILIVAYVIAVIIGYIGKKAVGTGEQMIRTKVVALRTLEVKVSALGYKAKSDAVSKMITQLKEKIHYSDPMGIDATADAEQDIKDQIDVIDSLLSSGADEAVVISAIEDAIVKVKIRNQLLSAVR